VNQPIASTHRPIRSFVRRAGRITAAQQRALLELAPRFELTNSAELIDFERAFGRTAPLTLEIGFGNGENLAALATAHPDRDYLGVEVHRPGVGHLFLLAEQNALSNVRAICHDAVDVLEQQIPVAALDEVLVLFPDPWHKARHHKRRLIQTPFVELLVTRLRIGGVFRLATDWEHYALQMLEVLTVSPALRNLSPTQNFMPRDDERIATRFERRGQRLGHDVWDLAFERV
jgi:tRNA (guanine-N7-)-methyltransferase